MSSDESVLALHDRVTRGDVLAPEEQAQLEQWYASQDTAELEMLRFNAIEATADVQSQITTVLERCVAIAQQIQDLRQSNEDARHELVRLRQQVAQHLQTA